MLRLTCAIAAVAITLTPLLSHAAPWLSPGDARARHSVQKLSDRGHLTATTTTWPLMWANLDSQMDASVSGDAESVGTQLAYLRFEQEQLAPQGFRAGFQLEGASDPAFLRGFHAIPREEGQATATLQWQGDVWAAGLSPSMAMNPADGKEVRLDGSYLAATAGNWVLGVGAIDRWWGPGWQSSMILSDNARPIPAVWIDRKESLAPESSYLSWIGPWQFTVFLGQLEEERVVPDAKLIGMRASFAPIQGLEIGLSRTITFGGEGRPEGFSTVWDALIGDDNIEVNEGETGEDDPSNQIAAIDIRYGFPLGNQSMSLYAQMMGEDEAGYLPSRKSWLFGIDWTTQLLDADQQWYLEATNTLADDLIGDAIPDYAYRHFQYETGYQYYGRAIGSTFDSDSEALTLGVLNFLDDGSNLSATLSYADLNKDGGNRVAQPNEKIFYHVPDGAQKVAIVNLGYGTELFRGWLDLNLQATDKRIQLLGGEKDQWSVSASWKYRF